jgi:hypothetical protein
LIKINPMNQKTVFTISSVLVVFALLFMACEKNTAATVATAATSGSTTASTGPNSITVDGTSHNVVTTNTVVGSAFLILSTSVGSSYPSSSIYFTGSSAPAAGSYTASANYPTSGNCGVTITPATSITWTVVSCNMTVTAGSSRAVTFTNSTFTDGTATHTVSANLPF